MKILITEFMEVKSVEMLNRNFDVTVDKSLSLNHNELKKIISNFDILIVRNKTQVNKEILENASSLKFIGRLGVGLDNIDTEYCRNNNIHVQPATGMNADSVAEYVINSALSLLKNIPIANIETQKGNWPRNTVLSRELKDKTIGILGFGLIGRKVCKIAQIFGAKVIAYDPYVDNKIAEEFDIKLESLDYVLNNSHIISLHIPLNNETNNLINFETIKLMKNKPIIINSSRGGIINEDHMIDAYLKNQISGFALDVFQNEPVQRNILDKINSTFNCILTPHNAGVTEESNIRVSQFIAESIIRFFSK
jgi:(S)-sulfolactate dehydrogenase